MQPHTEHLVDTIEHAAQQTHFSGVIFLKRHGQIVFEQAYGFADRSNRLPNTLDTRFGIASGSKFFTALSIGQLIEAGDLSLSSRLVECVQSHFPNISEDVTIGHLLTHTSGVYDTWMRSWLRIKTILGPISPGTIYTAPKTTCRSCARAA